MNILVTGNFDSTYNRTQILLAGLAEMSDVSVTLFPVRKSKEFKRSEFLNAIAKADVVYLPPFTHKFARALRRATRKPIVFDPLISKYLTKVFDYKQVSKYSPRALKNYLKDYLAFRACDILLADTEAHLNYFKKTFYLKNQKLAVLPIGADVSEFQSYDSKKKNPSIEIGFYGGFIPLQGTAHILDAAKLLSARTDIHFTLIGTGYEWEKAKAQATELELTNVDFPGWVNTSNLPAELNRFDFCLGIFGDTHKTDLVIPNKVYHYAAMGKAIISKDTPAIRELFTDNKNILLCENNAQDISKSILELADNELLRNRIAKSGLELITQKYNQKQIAERFVETIKSSNVL